MKFFVTATVVFSLCMSTLAFSPWERGSRHGWMGLLPRRRPLPRQRECPDGMPMVQCMLDPCDVATCPGNPRARCEHNFCGGCNAVFYDKTGAMADCNGDGCPDDKPMARCMMDPCDVTSCSANPDATCVADYCGGCNANFFDRSGEPACCGGEGQSCDTGRPIGRQDDCTCQRGLVCFPNEGSFTKGTCQTEEWVEENGGLPPQPIG
ncbi:uncharacterized protein LOC118407154 [Branchiostoma floridae]|uniref:Uncharacterized protein LOC118407154 n=1 Tax=Branchiostoma floridae TaxID=7739 RepID=A0A9J7HQ41_BRAFL|nr:uncharacterized protein LOC118407154 [Branchiostoma floridae]